MTVRAGDRSTPAPPHRRSIADKREKSFFVAHLVAKSCRYRCHVLNISRSGALIAGVDLPIADDSFDLDLATTSHPATVVWHDRGRWGISFAVRLTHEQLQACF